MSLHPTGNFTSKHQFALERLIIWTIKNVLCLRLIDCVCAFSLSIFLSLFFSYSEFKVHSVNSNRLSIAFSIRLLFHDCHKNSIQHNHSQQLDFRENKYTSVYFNLKLQMHFVTLFVTKINIKQKQQLNWEFTSSFHLRFLLFVLLYRKIWRKSLFYSQNRSIEYSVSNCILLKYDFVCWIKKIKTKIL